MAWFVEYGKDSRFLIRILTIIVVVQAVVIMALGFLAVKQRVLYVNPSKAIGTAYVGYVSDDSAAFFGMAFLYFLGNVNKYSVIEQYKTAYLLMSPQLQSAMKRTLDSDAADVAKSDISVETTPLTYKVEGNGEEFAVTINTTRISYVYGQPGKEELLQYAINCRKGHISKFNPYGLEVTSYDTKTLASGGPAIAAALQESQKR